MRDMSFPRKKRCLHLYRNEWFFKRFTSFLYSSQCNTFNSPQKPSSSPSFFQMYLTVPLPLLTSTKSLRHQYWMANLSLCLKQQEDIKTCGGTPPHILNPITGWKCVVSFKTLSLDPWYPLNKELSYLGYNLGLRVQINTSKPKFSLLFIVAL